MENYKQNIKKLKSEREIYKARILDLTESIENILNSFYLTVNKTLISWKQLKSLHIGKLYAISDEIQFLKTYEDHLEIRFEAYIRKTDISGINEYYIEEIVVSTQ
ncbi:hypothetical protein [Wenyingzhuangia sp. IMCC45574]